MQLPISNKQTNSNPTNLGRNSHRF